MPVYRKTGPPGLLAKFFINLPPEGRTTGLPLCLAKIYRPWLKIFFEVFALAPFPLPSLLFVKIKRAPAHSNNRQNFKIMTYVSIISADTNRRYKEYQIEVITFDGDSETVYVTARTSEEAQAMAAAQVPDADYTMVQGIFEN